MPARLPGAAALAVLCVPPVLQHSTAVFFGATVSTHRSFMSSHWFKHKSPLCRSFGAVKSTEPQIYPVSQQVCEYFEMLEVRRQFVGIFLMMLWKSQKRSQKYKFSKAWNHWKMYQTKLTWGQLLYNGQILLTILYVLEPTHIQEQYYRWEVRIRITA